MADSDIIIGSFTGGTVIEDSWGDGETSLAPDTTLSGGTDDIINSAAGESGGWTTLEFSRNQTTGDVWDNDIVTGVSTPLIWAYHNNNDDITKRHSERGFSSVTFTAATVPTAPQNLAAGYGDSQVSLTWTTPADDGGAAITNYNVYRATTSGGPFAQIATPTGTSHTDSGRTNGVTYYYQVSAVNSAGEGPNSTEVNATPRTTPTEPQNLQASYGDTQVDLSWTAPAYDGGATITKYLVYRATASAGPYTNIANTTGLSNTDTTVTNGVTYYYKVSAFNSEGEGPLTAFISVTPATVSTAPQGLAASYGDSQVSLSWAAPLDDGGSTITKYILYRATSTSGPFTNIANTTGLGYTDSSVTNGITYYYNVTAYNAEGESPSSNQVSATPRTTPLAPQNLQASYGDSQVSLTWTAPADDGGATITKYLVYRATISSGPYTNIANTTGLGYTDTTVTNGVTYYYKVSAFNSEGEGPLTAFVTVTPATVPTAPQSLAASYGDSQVSLSWAVPADDGGATITKYLVYRATASLGPYTNIANTTGLGYTDTTVTNGVTYYYKVSAYNSEGEGPLTNFVSVIPGTVPSAPQSLQATYGDSQVSLTWTAPVNDGGFTISEYMIYRATSASGPYTNIANTTGLGYTDTSVTNGVTYFYNITAVNAEGEGPSSNQVSVTPATIPTAPQNLQATYGDSQVSLTWTAPSDDGGYTITKYLVYRATASGGPYTNIANTTGLGYTDTTVTNGVTYYYKVSAYTSEGEGPLTNFVSVTPGTVPSAPQSLQATYGDSQVFLTWTAPVNDGGFTISEYMIYRATSASGPYTNIANTTGLGYTDTSVTNGVTYFYNITAVNAEGEGPSSNQVSVTPATVPSAPQNLQATYGDSQVSLTWTAPANDGGYTISEYMIYRATSASGPYTNIANTTGLSYTDFSVTNGITYYYNVSAVTAEGEGASSNQISVTPATVPTAPQNLQASAGDWQVSLTWTAPANDGGYAISEYMIYRATSAGGPYTNIANTTGLGYTDTGVTNGVTYYYNVSAVNAEGEGPSSNQVSATPTGPPTPPQNLEVNKSGTTVTLNWTTPSNNGGSAITHYRVFRSQTSGGPYTNIDNTSLLSYVDTTVINGQKYYYVVTAVNGLGESGQSNEVSITIGDVPSVPLNPSAVHGDGQINVSWQVPASQGAFPIFQYRVYRGSSPGGPYTNVANVTVLFYLDTSVTNGQTYYYVITAENNDGESPFSTEVFATPATIPTAPQSLQATYGDSQVSLTWTAPTDDGGSAIIRYRIFRSLSSGGPFTNIANTTGLSYTDFSVINGVTYYYNITAVNAEGEGPFSNQISVTPATVPTGPQNLQATYGDSQVSLTWIAPADDGGYTISEYMIYRATSATGPYTNIANTTGLSYTDFSVTNGVTYYYNITAVNAEGEGASSNQVSVTPATVPTAPQNLQASHGDSQVSLTWMAPADDGGSTIVKYRIFRSQSPGGPYTNIVNVTGLLYVDTGLTNGIGYYYVLVAVNGEGESVASSEASATPGSVPTAPQSLQAAYDDSQVSLIWTAPTNDGGSTITEYMIYRATSATGPYTNIANTTGLSYTDFSVTNGVTYYYNITAVNAEGEGPSSNQVSVTPATAPTAPQNLQATYGNSQVSLTWTAPTDDGGSAIIRYRIYRALTTGGPYTNIINVTGLSYLDTSVVNGVQYFYIVIAVNGEGESVASIEVSSTPASVPTAPQSLQTTYSDSQVTLTWTPPSDDGGSTIAEYMVYRSTSPSGPFVNVGNSTTLNYIDSTVSNGVTYWYNVTAVNAEGEGLSSNQVSTTPATVPTAPLNPQLTSGDSQLSLSWETPIDDGGSAVLRYRILRSQSPGGPYTNIVNVTGLSYLDTGLTNGLEYYYVLIAVNGEGDSVASVEISAVPLTIPTSPQTLTATYTNPKVTLSWNAPSDDGGSTIILYKVYRSTTSGGPYNNIANISVLTYDDLSTTKGPTYFYTVSAENILGESSKSNEVFIATLTKPGPPESLFASLDANNHVALSWSSPSDTGGLSILGYQVYRSLASGGPYTLIAVINSLSHTDDTVEPGTTYFYVVRAVNALGESIDSNEEGILIPGSPTPTTTPPTTPTTTSPSTTTEDPTIPQTSPFAFDAFIAAVLLFLIAAKLSKKRK
jgi:titin